MDELVAESGDGDIEVALTWSNGDEWSTGAEATRGDLWVSLRGTPVWYGHDEREGFEWSWIELLEFLAEYWLYLSVEDGPPLGVALDAAPRMLAAAEAAIESGAPLGSRVEREQLEAYRATHDLAEAVQGAVLPPLWIVRDGYSGWVASTTMTATAPIAELMDVLTRVGNFIASRLHGMTDDRSIMAVQSWHDRCGSTWAALWGTPPDSAGTELLAIHPDRIRLGDEGCDAGGAASGKTGAGPGNQATPLALKKSSVRYRARSAAALSYDERSSQLKPWSAPS